MHISSRMLLARLTLVAGAFWFTYLLSISDIAAAQQAGRSQKQAILSDSELKKVTSSYARPSLSNRLFNALLATQSIKPAFSWSMPDRRYGRDRNNDGLIDLPNSFEYVHNVGVCPCVEDDCLNKGPQFRVQFDASGTQFPPIGPPPPAPSPSGAPEEGSPPEYPTPSPHELYAQFRGLMRQLQWEVDGEPREFAKLAMQWVYETCLPEGEFTVTLRAVDNFTEEWKTRSRRITVEDFLIVTLGDSYASGEGNPEFRHVTSWNIDWNSVYFNGEHNTSLSDWRRMRIEQNAAWKIANHYRAPSGLSAVDGKEIRVAIWADDGQPPGPPTVKRIVEGMFINGSQVIYEIVVPIMWAFDQFSPQRKEHDRSHRSSFAASSQAALELENASDKYSVTFVNLAMTGATINEGILGNYNGASTSRFWETADMRAQIDQLRDMVGKRKIDILYISVGGNDIGFGNAVVGLLLRDQAPPYFRQVDFGKIIEGVRTGLWQEVENSIGFFSWLVSWTEKKGMDRLLAAYDELATKIAAYGFTFGQIAISEYPDFTAEIDSNGDLIWCDQILGGIKFPLQIDTDELKWAYNNILIPLNEKIREASQNRGWTYIGGIAARTDGHGLCAARPYQPENYSPSLPVPDRPNERVRWFRTAAESEVIQLDGERDKTFGTAHPNELGHQSMKKALLDAWARPSITDSQPWLLRGFIDIARAYRAFAQFMH